MRAALCFLGLLASPLFAQARFDILITGARIVDGSGGSWFVGDIGINGDTIAAVTASTSPAGVSQTPAA
jgi:N-acyl-D-aspartate/D-glutamate deacylase